MIFNIGFSKTLTSELSVIKQLLLQNQGQKSGGYSIPVRRKPKRKEVESERFVLVITVEVSVIEILKKYFRIYEDENQNEDSLLKRF